MAAHTEAFPQQCLQRDEPHFPIVSPSFDDYSFAPILRTTSFECDDNDSYEVWYTPVEEKGAIALVEKESKSLPAPTVSKELGCPDVKLPASRSAPASPSSSSASSAQQTNRLKLNLPFKLNGFKSLTKSSSRSKFSRKSPKADASESPISANSSRSILNHGTERTFTASSCDISVTETEITQVFSNLTGRLVQEISVNDSFDDIQLNPIPQPSFYKSSSVIEPITSGVLCGIGVSEDEVELVFNENMSTGIESKTELEVADCDVYYAGGSIDTVHGACGELGVLAATALGTPSRKTQSTPMKTSPDMVSPNTTDTTGSSKSPSSLGSASSHSSTSSSGILKPPKLAIKGYDPFGVHTADFVMPTQRVHFENIDEFDTAYRGSLLLSEGESGSSDDSTSSLEYALEYFGCAGSTMSDSSSESYFVSVRKS